MLVPRIDYTRMRGALRNPEEKRAPRSRHRPLTALFDVDKIKLIIGITEKNDQFTDNKWKDIYIKIQIGKSVVKWPTMVTSWYLRVAIIDVAFSTNLSQ
jgi:hypothetical protein